MEDGNQMINILYEDNHLLVALKPVNIPVCEDSSSDDDFLNMLKHYLEKKYNKKNAFLGLVHRLDRPVGGVMVFAKTSKAAKRLNEQIKNHEFNKIYLAVLDGTLKNKNGKLVNYLYKDEKLKKSMVVDKSHLKAKLSELNYEVIGYNDDTTIVKITLITGRHHQIRVQCSNIGYPLVGDQLYGKENKKQIMLYAYKLEFIHPTTKEKMTYQILPEWKELENETIIHRL